MLSGHANTCITPQDCWCEVRNLSRVFFVTLGILLVEVLGYFLSGSLALLSDAGHVFGDNAAITVGMVVAILTKWHWDPRRTIRIGFSINIFLLIAMCGWIIHEAWERYQNPQEVEPIIMIIVAAIGAGGNVLQHLLLEQMAPEHKHAVHQTISAHVRFDLYQSLGIALGGIIILFTGWYLVDLTISVLIVVLIGYQIPKLVRDARRGDITLHTH